MFLRSLDVHNFRGIVAGRLDLDETTVLIGENDCGKSSLLSALEVVLASGNGDRPAIGLHHFHRPVGPAGVLQGPVRIELTFEERSAGDWNQASLGSLVAVLPAPSTGVRRLSVRVQAEAPEGDAPPVAHWTILSPGSGKAPSEDDTGHLAAIRRLCPLVWLQSGMLLGATSLEDPGRSEPLATGKVAELAAAVESHYAALLAGTSSNELEELKAGYEAARELLRQRAEEFQSAGNLSYAPMAEVLGGRAGKAAAGLPYRGSAAQQIGVLIVTAAVIRHGLNKWIPEAVPLLVLEDPEAHLHLMTLASVWGLIAHARAQKVIGTQSEALLGAVPLHSIRRLTRSGGNMRQWRVGQGALCSEDVRKLSYHLRARRGEAMYARCWLLAEGETEFWVLPELARLLGYDLALEGVAVVEFAQCGLTPLIKLARELGIEWHVLSDGDGTGRDYADEARRLAGGEAGRRVTQLRERDVEHCFWHHGYAQVYERATSLGAARGGKIGASRVIRHAIKRHSKPYLAFEALAAVAADGSPGVPAPLKRTIDTCIQLARGAPAREEPATEPLRPRRPRGHRQGRGR